MFLGDGLHKDVYSECGGRREDSRLTGSTNGKVLSGIKATDATGFQAEIFRQLDGTRRNPYNS